MLQRLGLINRKIPVKKGASVSSIIISTGSTPHPVTVANEGLVRDSLLKIVIILVVTVSGWGGRSNISSFSENKLNQGCVIHLG